MSRGVGGRRRRQGSGGGFPGGGHRIPVLSALFVLGLTPAVMAFAGGQEAGRSSSVPTRSEDRFAIEAFAGGAFVSGSTLRIAQQGHPLLEFEPEYASESLRSPIYYSGRARFFRGAGAWEVQFTHLKAILENPPAEVELFEISHGYNLFTLNRSWSGLPITLRVGAGVVIPQAESIVRGRRRVHGGEADYGLTGPVLLVGAGKELDLAGPVFLSLEAQATLARAHVPVGDGTARASTIAIHALGGLGVRF